MRYHPKVLWGSELRHSANGVRVQLRRPSPPVSKECGMTNRIEIIEAAVIGFTQQKQKIESQVVDLRR